MLTADYFRTVRSPGVATVMNVLQKLKKTRLKITGGDLGSPLSVIRIWTEVTEDSSGHLCVPASIR